MILDPLNDWLRTAPLLLLAGTGAVLMVAAAVGGARLRALKDGRAAALDIAPDDGIEGIIASAVLGLLALLMGFTFSLVLNRFEDRRALVLEEVNAIGTVYLRVQLLEEPHRARLSRMIVDYTDNRILLAKAPPGQNGALLARNDAMVTDLWAATVAAVDTIENPGLTAQVLSATNAMIDLDTSRKAARVIHIPAAVYVVMLVFLATAAGLLGYLSGKRRGKAALALMIVLLSLTLLLILDVDRPTGGSITESQWPMEALAASLKTQPPAVFDRYRATPSASAPRPAP